MFQITQSFGYSAKWNIFYFVDNEETLEGPIFFK